VEAKRVETLQQQRPAAAEVLYICEHPTAHSLYNVCSATSLRLCNLLLLPLLLLLLLLLLLPGDEFTGSLWDVTYKGAVTPYVQKAVGQDAMVRRCCCWPSVHLWYHSKFDV
jgi:hypothetical protein